MMHNDDDSGCDVMGKVEDNRAVTGEKDKEKDLGSYTCLRSYPGGIRLYEGMTIDALLPSLYFDPSQMCILSNSC